MPAPPYDFAVFGSNVMSCLLAGLLAAEHGKRVCLIGAIWSPFHLPRRLDLSAMPATRPETWAMLQSGTAEVLRLLAGMEKGLYERVDPVLVAERPDTADMLSHMRHVTQGLGIAAERVIDSAVVGTGTGCRIRDAVLLVPGRIERAVAGWLQQCGVRRLPWSDATATLQRSGGARLGLGGEAMEAERAVFADDAAILTFLDEETRGSVLLSRPVASVMTEATATLSAPLIHYLDRDVMLMQRVGKGPVTAIAAGPAEVLPRIASCLPGRTPLLRAGHARFTGLATADGAPLVGALPRSKATVIAGLGLGAAFFSAALARLLVGASTEAERAYFAAREPSRRSSRLGAADWADDPVPEPQA